MATLWIEEEPDIPLAGRGVVPVHDASRGNRVQQKKTISGTSQKSSAFGDNTSYITVHADAECYIDIALSPTATTTTTHLAANVYRTFKVSRGNAWKVAVKDTT